MISGYGHVRRIASKDERVSILFLSSTLLCQVGGICRGGREGGGRVVEFRAGGGGGDGGGGVQVRSACCGTGVGVGVAPGPLYQEGRARKHSY